ncbi:MAG: FtsX-like permease family protein, partial [Solirubrobacteraceae bacterium]
MIGYARTLALFYRRHLRVQPLRELMAIAGIAAGVALLFAVQVAHHSITGSFEAIEHGVAGRATLEVAARGPEGASEAVAEAVERTPGVKAVAPLLSEPIVVVGPRGRRALTLVGATEQVRALHGPLSSAFERAGEGSHRGFLLLTQSTASAIGARVGGASSRGGRSSRVSVLIGGRREAIPLAAIVASSKLGAAAGSPIAAAPLPIVQAAAGLPGRVGRVLVQPQPGREAQLRAALSRRFGARLTVRPVDGEARLLARADSAESEVTLLFSVISLVAGVILAYNALLLASEERRRFVSYLIETGTPDSMVLGSLIFDALILGAAGCALGLLAGEAISLLAYASVPGYVAAAFPVGPSRVVSTQIVLIAIAGGLLAALAAALLPALAILRGSAIAEPQAVGHALSFTRRLRASQRGTFAVGVALVVGSL